MKGIQNVKNLLRIVILLEILKWIKCWLQIWYMSESNMGVVSLCSLKFSKQVNWAKTIGLQWILKDGNEVGMWELDQGRFHGIRILRASCWDPCYKREGITGTWLHLDPLSTGGNLMS